MYFVIVKEIESGKIIDKVELTATDNIGGELVQLAWTAKNRFKSIYPPDKYQVLIEEANNSEELLHKHEQHSEETFTMIGSRSNFLMISVFAMLAGMFLIFFLLFLRLLYNPFIFIICIIILFLYLYIDYNKWVRNGIHIIKIDNAGLSVFRGTDNIPTRINKEQITGISDFKKLNRRIINILLGSPANSSIPGVTIFSGPRIRITNDAFNDYEFNVFLKKLHTLINKPYLE